MHETPNNKILSDIIGNTPRTIDNHAKEGRPYIRLLQYFTRSELEEFLEYGRIEKLELIKKLSLPQLRNCLVSDASTSNEMLLKNALFKVNFGMEKSFVLPIFKDSIRGVNPNDENILDTIRHNIGNGRLGIFGHENHKKLAIDIIEKYFTDAEIRALITYFKTAD